MKTLKIPKMLHDVLGEETTLIELSLIGLFTIIIIAGLTAMNGTAFTEHGLLKGGIAFLLVADIIAGTLANFTKGTNAFYAKRPVNRWIFIAIHVQPLILAWLFGGNLLNAAYLWLWVLVTASLTNRLSGHPLQRIIGAFFMGIGVFLSLMLYQNDQLVLLTANLFFVIKVVFSFSVNHENTTIGLTGGNHEDHVL